MSGYWNIPEFPSEFYSYSRTQVRDILPYETTMEINKTVRLAFADTITCGEEDLPL